MAPSAVCDRPSLRAEWLAHPSGICALAWSTDGHRLASGGNDGLVHVWSPDAPSLGPLLTLSGHEGSVRSLSWSPDGNRLASGAEDSVAIIWDARTGEACLTLRGHERWLNAVAWSPDGATVVTASGDRRLVVWDVADGTPRTVLRSPYGTFLGVAWSPCGGWLAACSRSDTVTVWDARSWTVDACVAPGCGAVWSVEYLAGARLLAVGGDDGSVVILDPLHGEVLARMEGHGSTVARVTCSPSSDVAASLSHDLSIGLWSLPEPRWLGRIEPAYPGWTGCLAFHPAEPILAGVDAEGRGVRLWTVPPATTAPKAARGAFCRDASCEAAVAVVDEARRRGDAWISIDAVDDLVGRRVGRGVARRLDTAGEILFIDRDRRVFLPARSLGGLVDAVERGLSHRGPGVHRIRLSELVAVDDERLGDPGLARRAVASWLIRGGRAWVDAAGEDDDMLAIPAVAGTVVVDLVDTTLFEAWAWHEDHLWLRDDQRTAVAACIGPQELVLHAQASAPGHRMAALLKAVVARRLGRRRPAGDRVSVRLAEEGEGVPPRPAVWHGWDPTARRTWALTWADLPADLVRAAEVVDELVDDERARKERLMWAPVAGRPDDVVICHLPEDRAHAGRIADELDCLGLRSSFHCGADDDAVQRAHRAGVVILVVSPGMEGRWDDLPIRPFYEATVARSQRTGHRIRWLPTALEGTGRPRGVPDFLHSFDWFCWYGNPRPRRRESLLALLGGVVVDRARS